MFNLFRQKKKSKGKNKEPQVEHPEQVVKALEVLFASKFIDKKSLYFHNFLRGIAMGAGSVIGATVVIALLIWILSLFDTLPFVGPLFENTQETIREKR